MDAAKNETNAYGKVESAVDYTHLLPNTNNNPADYGFGNLDVDQYGTGNLQFE